MYKVILQGPRDDSRTQGTKISTKKNAGVQIEGRGKRAITKPAYLRDYV